MMLDESITNTTTMLKQISLLIALVGCAPPAPTPKGPPMASDSKNIVIREGFGFERCHVGMKVEELSVDWIAAHILFPEVYEENTLSRSIFYYSKFGAFAGCYDGKVSALSFVYDAPDRSYANFRGTTSKGIGGDSTIEDIFKAYGVPDAISNTGPLDATTGRRYSFNYVQRGINFYFGDGKLDRISVTEPKSPPLPSYLTDDIGDTTELRRIAEKHSKELQTDEDK